MAESRKSSRVEAQHFISYDVLDSSGSIILSGMALSLDLSKKGVQLETRQEFPEDALVRLHLAVGEDIVDVDGKIRHMEKVNENVYHIGVEFLEIEEERLQRIGRHYPDILKE